MAKTLDNIAKDLESMDMSRNWFDLWHTHVDMDGKGNESWENRIYYLNKLIEFYNGFQEIMTNYHQDFQLWIEIDENDSAEDTVYIHTKNPNEDNFPLKIEGTNEVSTTNNNLKHFLLKTGLEIIEFEHSEGKMWILYKHGVGLGFN